MNPNTKLRQKMQLQLRQSGVNIEVGEPRFCPLPVRQLATLDRDSPQVEITIDSGKSCIVHKLAMNGRHWCLKQRRHKDWQGNIDGDLSFLNEILRRQEFYQIKHNIKYAHQLDAISETCYASLHDGFILSPWIESLHALTFDEQTLQQIFATLTQLELEGFFEWDLSASNFLFDSEEQRIKLFDFGYMYRFNPLKEFNCNGLAEPMFHSVERFEAGCFFSHLAQMERQSTQDEVLKLYELEKRLALQAYQRKAVMLKGRYASGEVLAWLDDIMTGWQMALQNPARLADLYLLESFRMNVLDVNDALNGHQCSALTLYRLEKILNLLNEHFSLLKLQKGLLFDDDNCSKQQLIENYQRKLILARQYQS